MTPDPGSDALWGGETGGRGVVSPAGLGGALPGDGKFGSRSRLGCGPGKGAYRAVALGMGKEQELLEAARTGHLPAVEKLLSGKRLSSGFGGGGSSGGSGGGSGGGGGLGSSSHTLSSLLRWVTHRGQAAA